MRYCLLISDCFLLLKIIRALLLNNLLNRVVPTNEATGNVSFSILGPKESIVRVRQRQHDEGLL